MCTSAAVYWAVACVTDLMKPLCSQNDMDTLMRTAARTHMIVTKHLGKSSSYMLQQHEMLSIMTLPVHVQGAETFGYCMHKQNDLKSFLHIDEIFCWLKPGDGMVITGGRHTTAVHKDHQGHVYAFDSLPACVTRLSSSDELRTTLLASHANMAQFTATVFRTDCTRLTRRRGQ